MITLLIAGLSLIVLIAIAVTVYDRVVGEPKAIIQGEKRFDHWCDRTDCHNLKQHNEIA